MSWTVLGESVVGTSHRGRQAPCQDAFRVRTIGPEGEWLVVAVCDGAGSASHSELGAQLVCEELTLRVEALGPERFTTSSEMVELMASGRAVVLEKAGELGLAARELACTVLLGVVGPRSAAFAQIGDGAMVVRDADRYRCPIWPEVAEYVNASDFLTDESFADAIRFELIPEAVDEVAVFSDGLQRLALDFTNRIPHRNFFAPLFNALRTNPDPRGLLEPFRAFLDSNEVNARSDDDKTLVLATRRI